jgi:Glycosyl hydrolases family 35
MPGSASATVRWQAPATVDGAPVTSYTVTASTGQRMTADEPSHWAIVPSLTDGAPVTFTVTATSTAGTSAPSPASAPVTPEALAPPHHVLRGRPQSDAFDKYSVTIGGRRVLIWAGEFDYYRLPSPSLWIDRLEEMKAAGFNAVSIYFDWDYHSAAPGVYSFGGVRDINLLLNDAQADKHRNRRHHVRLAHARLDTAPHSHPLSNAQDPSVSHGIAHMISRRGSGRLSLA